MVADVDVLVVGGGPAGLFTAPQVVATAISAGMTVERPAEMEFAYPTFTEAVSMSAQKVCRQIGTGQFPPVWSYLGPEE
jgi:2-polyprenyl-6-methoxyphenol hydroxylase-like FAD-dependent oxidoreductase